jgi:DNA polymerase III delta prime subunit
MLTLPGTETVRNKGEEGTDANQARRNLSTALRPSSLEEFVGAEEIKKSILLMLESRLPSAVLFSGNPGSGKTTIARILARLIQSTEEQWYDINEINGADCNTADDARSLIEKARFAPLFGDYKVIIVDEAQRMTAAAQQILLKDVEEPPPSLLWIFCTSAPSKIDSALQRRCVQYAIPALTPKEVGTLICRCLKSIGGVSEMQFLQTGKYEELVEVLIANQIFTPGHIVMALDKFISGVSAGKAAGVMLSSIDALEVARETAQGNWKAVQTLLQHASPDDGRAIRACVTSYFRAVLAKAQMPARAQLAAWAIHQLSGHGTSEEGLQLSATAASLYFICERIKPSDPHVASRRGADGEEAVSAVDSNVDWQ